MKVASEEELKNAPKGFKSAAYKGKEFAGKQFIWQMSPEDCTGCGICVSACPAKNKANPERKAINMDHIENHLEEQVACWNFFETLPASPNSAQTESACAGALGVQLAGPAYYFGEYYDKPTIGDALRPVEPKDILRADRMMYAESLLALVLGIALRLLVLAM